MRNFIIGSCLLVLLSCTGPVLAQDQLVPCAAPEYRQFDFWIGEWIVTRHADGMPAGANRIEKVFNGCALHESWTSANGGFAGSSYNTYDPARGVWHQTWVDTAGQLLLLEGGLNAAGQMVLQEERERRDGKGRVTNRITWAPRDDGTVRQHWQASTDGGETWTDVFDGIYQRKMQAAAPAAERRRPLEGAPAWVIRDVRAASTSPSGALPAAR